MQIDMAQPTSNNLDIEAVLYVLKCGYVAFRALYRYVVCTMLYGNRLY